MSSENDGELQVSAQESGERHKQPEFDPIKYYHLS